MTRISTLAAGSLLGSFLLFCQEARGQESIRAPSGAGPGTADLVQAAQTGDDWLYHTRDFAGTRHSPLDQIDIMNAGELQLACLHQVGGDDFFQSGPVVFDGVMYFTAGSRTLALDAADCTLRWSHEWEYQLTPRTTTNRGVAISDGYVVRGTADGFLLALDAEDGRLLWARQVADAEAGEHFTMAPMIWNDRILIGPAGGMYGISGWLGAFTLADGSLLWKFHTVPGAVEGESDSWGNTLGIRIGGGALWTPLSLDAATATLYVAVANPAPDFPANLRPGDNLYTNSVLALDAVTGDLRWYRQFIANDDHGWDLTQVSPLYSLNRQGNLRQLLAASGKDGLLRLVDRQSGEPVAESPVSRRENTEAPVIPDGTRACPGVLGGVLWNGPALVPEHELLVTPAVNLCATFYLAREPRYIEGVDYFGGTVVSDPDTLEGWITATDAFSGERRWQYRSPLPVVAAVTATAGGLILAGEMSGDFLVLAAADGEELYRFNTGGPVGGGIITYAVAGRQYIAVASGRPSPTLPHGEEGTPVMLVFALPAQVGKPGYGEPEEG